MPILFKTFVSRPIAMLAAAAALLTSAAAWAEPAAPAAASASAGLQGDQTAWINDPHTRAFYNLTVAAFANGPAAVDKVKFEQDSQRLFRDFGQSAGLKPGVMEDHLKMIPDQMIQIVTEDPTVLSSFDRFVAALFGPQ